MLKITRGMKKNDESYQFIIYNSDKKSKIQLK